jgi:hypothetical protein
MLKTTSSSSPRTDLSNKITFSQPQSHATVRLNSEKCIFPVQRLHQVGGAVLCVVAGASSKSLHYVKKMFSTISKLTMADLRKEIWSRAYCRSHLGIFDLPVLFEKRDSLTRLSLTKCFEVFMLQHKKADRSVMASGSTNLKLRNFCGF